MSKDQLLSIVRSALVVIGMFIVGHTVAGHTVDSTIWETIGGATGAVMAVLGAVLGIKDKSTGPEQWASLLRSLILGIGGIGVSWGLYTDQKFQAISGLLLSLIPVILSQLNRTTVKQIETGEVKPEVKPEIKMGAPTGKTIITGKVVKAAA